MKAFCYLAINALLACPALAIPLYFDINGNTTGFGSSSGGSWNWLGGGFWNTVPQGTTGITSWVDGNTPIFRVAGSYTISTGIGTRRISGLRAEAGAFQINGDRLFLDQLANTELFIESGLTTTILANVGGQVANPNTGVFPTVSKTGAGTLVLTGINTFTAPLTIAAGTVRIGDAGGILASQQVTVNSGATLDLNDVDQTLTGLSGAGAVNLGTLNAGGLTFNPGLNNSSVFSGVISGTAAVSKTGEGIQILSGANTFTNPINLNQGELQIGNASKTGSIAASAVTVATAARLTFYRSDAQSYVGTISGPGKIVSQGGPLTLTGDVSSAIELSGGNRVILSRSSNSTYAQPVTGLGDLEVKPAATTLTYLTGQSTFSGNLYLTGLGTTVVQGGTDRLPTAASAVVNAFAALQFETSQTLNSIRDLPVTSGTTTSTGKLGINNGSTLSIRTNLDTSPNSDGVYTFSGPVLGHPFVLNFSRNSGLGIVTHRFTDIATSTNTTPSTVNVGDGTRVGFEKGYYTVNVAEGGGVILGPAAFFLLNLPTTPGPSNVTFTGSSATLRSLNGARDIALGGIVLNVGNFSGTDSVYAGSLSGSGILTKYGSSSLTLTGASINTGETSLREGRIILNGSMVAPMKILQDATLSGTGTVSGLVTLQGKIEPGNGVGTMTIGGLSADQSSYPSAISSLVCDTTASATDKLIVTGDVNLSGLQLTLLGTDPFPAGATRTILEKTTAGAIVDIFQDLPEGRVIRRGSQYLRISYLGGTGNDITLTALTAADLPKKITSSSFAPSIAGNANSPLTAMVNFQSLPGVSGLTLQTSTNLVDWTTYLNGSSPQNYATDTNGIAYITATIPGTSKATTPKLFVRLIVP
jgi:fibronectin-binding autotransporter adhesin